jgi:multidrug efflux system outer membrane protein
MRGLAVATLTGALLAGCAVGPNHRRPIIPVPEAHRGALEHAEAESLADLKWWEVFGDPALQRLVDDALRQNLDLEAAVARVEQARNFVTVARSDVFPQIGYAGEASRQRAGGVTFNSFTGLFNLAWELDVWGRIRRATEAARADYLGSIDAQRGVMLSLVSAVAQAYFELLELDAELEIAKRTTEAFDDTLHLFTRRFEGGVGSRLEVMRAEAARADSAAAIPEIERLIVLKENQIAVLLGRTPGPITRGAALDAQTMPPVTPPGLPSQLLERRPDVLQAEQAVVAANATVGVTVANFFPRIGLTSFYGEQSDEIENLVKGGGSIWAIAGQATGPIFQGGRLLGGYRAARAAWEEAIALYERTALDAFREVSDTLTTQVQLVDVREERERQVDSLTRAVDLAQVRYDSGLAYYFEVIDAQQELFPAELLLARTRRDQLIATVVLYRALGGGWSLPTDVWTTPEAGAEPAAPATLPAP